MGTDYLPVDIGLLQPEMSRPFGLYVRLGERFLPYLNPGDPFTEATQRRLLEEGVGTLFVSRSERQALREYMDQNLEKILREEGLSSREKARIVYDICLYQIERLWEMPRSPNIEKSKQVIRQTVDYIVSSNRSAIQHLLLMMTHEPGICSHCVNVGLLGTSLAREVYRNTSEDLHEIGCALFLHDIGKTQIDPRILSKPGPLDSGEWEIMKLHPVIGHRILEEEGHLTSAAAVTTLEHHERCNGVGYPLGLKSAQIHPLGKVCNLVDSYDALLSSRVYKPAFSPYKALKIMKDEMRGQFDRQVFKEFLYLLY